MTRALVTITIVIATWLGVGAFVYAHTQSGLLAFFAAQTVAPFMLVAMIPEWTE